MTRLIEDLPFTLPALTEAYRSGLTPAAVMSKVLRRIDASRDPVNFLSRIDLPGLVAQAIALGSFDPEKPLLDIPLTVKYNIEVAGLPTTAACPVFAYGPLGDAAVVVLLR